MIPKPSGCVGCPFAKHGKYFTPDTIVPDSKVMFIAQNPGPDEEAGRRLIKRTWHYSQSHDEYKQVKPAPLIGATGQMFNKQFLPLSRLSRDSISLANAIRCRPGHSLGLKADELPNITTTMKLDSSKADIVRALKHCRDTYLKIPNSVQVIVTMGRYAMFSLTGIQNEESEYGKKQGVMQSWRGYAVEVDSFDRWNTVDTSYYHSLQGQYKIMFTMHLAALYKGDNSKYHHATLQDFHKLGRLLSGKWPLPLPSWHTVSPQQWPKVSAFDTEYIPDGNQLIRWSMCDVDYNLYCVEADSNSNDYIPVNPHSTVIIQNALADISHLSNIVNMDMVQIEDMMLADSVLWTGEPHSLNFIASKYGAFNRYKHLSVDNPQLYSALDAYEPMHMWRHHYIPEFKADPQSWKVYKKYRLPLINIINKAQLTGAKVDTARLSEVQYILQNKLNSLQQQARDITGIDTFNLGGRKQLQEQLYGQ
jgi:uracil-DNA glycosylase